MTNLLADVRLALRSWRKAPGFAGIAILSIALGIGANTAIFTLVDQVLLRMLPVRDPHELVQITFSGLPLRQQLGRRHRAVVPGVQGDPRQQSGLPGRLRRFGTAFHIGAAGPNGTRRR